MDSGLRKHSNLDILRSVICSIARSDSDNQLKKSHILKIENLANFFGFNGKCALAMDQLSDLKEVQRLGNGFWLPAPTRSVPLNEGYLIISPLPTTLFPGDLGLESEVGFARVANLPFPDSPIQCIEDWMGSPRSLLKWIREELSHVENFLVRTVLQRENLEFYAPWLKNSLLKSNYRNWINASDIPLSQRNAIFLARNIDGLVTSYFWCTFRDGILLESTNTVKSDEIIRIQFALEILNNAPRRELTIDVYRNAVSFNCRFSLPSDIERFLVAIGTREPLEKGSKYTMKSKYLDLLKDIFVKINIKFR